MWKKWIIIKYSFCIIYKYEQGDYNAWRCWNWKKSKFKYSEHPVDISNVDIDKIIISNKVSLGKKCFNYFVGYKDEGKVKLYV